MENNRIHYQERVYSTNIIFNKFFIINHLFKKEIFDNKYIIAYALQTLYEKIILYIVSYSIEKYKIKNLGYCGGGAFNVKLNNLILNCVPEKLIINPVPSDLGINYFKYQKDIINSYNRYTLPKKFNKHLED
jgi:predicted NodU family carbamoyl transferase